jgi:hypothetical protein
VGYLEKHANGNFNKHAPCRSRRIGKKRSSWITNDLKRQMFKRDYLKKKAISSQDPHAWHEYKQSRNHVNVKLKKSRHHILPQTLSYIKAI